MLWLPECAARLHAVMGSALLSVCVHSRAPEYVFVLVRMCVCVRSCVADVCNGVLTFNRSGLLSLLVVKHLNRLKTMLL